MFITNKEELMKMETPILFSRYQPQVIEGLYMCIDNKWSNIDFTQASLLDCVIPIEGEPEYWGSGDESDLLIDAVEKGIKFKLDLEANEREAMYDNNSLYMVYEKEDIKKLVDKLSALL